MSLTAGSGSYSTSIAAAASAAISGVRAATAATMSAFEAHAVSRAKSLRSLARVAVEHVGDVLVREDGEDARQRPCLRRVDRDDARVRVVGVAELRVQLACEVQVGRVPARRR